MPYQEAPCEELGSAPRTPSIVLSPTPSEISTASSPEPSNVRATPLFRALAMPPPDPEQPLGQEELERRLPGYRRIVIPRELTLIELLKECSGVTADEEVLLIKEAKLRVVAERVGLRRLHVLSPRLRSLTLDGSALTSLRDLGIGLVHLKMLSVNRCRLTCLDGVWGLSALRELHAAGNRLQDLQPLAALQKLHTLNLADNPITESSRVWTLGICSSLRNLTLRGTPAADSPDYPSTIAAALPMLVYLDDRPLHLDIESETESFFEAELLNSDSEPDEADKIEKVPEPCRPELAPGPSTSCYDLEQEVYGDVGSYGDLVDVSEVSLPRLCRPNTTEGAGVRPRRPHVPPRPKTAIDKNVQGPAKMQFLNTLLDNEWLCSGSRLTSQVPVYGNLARALRRPLSVSSHRRNTVDDEIAELRLDEASRSIADEIPRVPRFEDWEKFRQDTGIEIDIDFNERPKGADPNQVIERLERIEKETFERFGEGAVDQGNQSQRNNGRFSGLMGIDHQDCDLWNFEPPTNVEDLFKNIPYTG